MSSESYSGDSNKRPFGLSKRENATSFAHACRWFRNNSISDRTRSSLLLLPASITGHTSVSTDTAQRLGTLWCDHGRKFLRRYKDVQIFLTVLVAAAIQRYGVLHQLACHAYKYTCWRCGLSWSSMQWFSSLCVAAQRVKTLRDTTQIIPYQRIIASV